MLRVLAFGEAPIDFVPLQGGRKLADTDTFASLPGGAPANVAACIARLGGAARFAGEVGQDAFGDRIEQTLRAVGVDLRWLQRATEAKTALGFVTLADSGERVSSSQESVLASDGSLGDVRHRNGADDTGEAGREIERARALAAREDTADIGEASSDIGRMRKCWAARRGLIKEQKASTLS